MKYDYYVFKDSPKSFTIFRGEVNENGFPTENELRTLAEYHLMDLNSDEFEDLKSTIVPFSEIKDHSLIMECMDLEFHTNGISELADGFAYDLSDVIDCVNTSDEDKLILSKNILKLIRKYIIDPSLNSEELIEDVSEGK